MICCSAPGVVAALRRLGIATGDRQNGHARRGQVSFGWDLQDCRVFDVLSTVSAHAKPPRLERESDLIPMQLE